MRNSYSSMIAQEQIIDMPDLLASSSNHIKATFQNEV